MDLEQDTGAENNSDDSPEREPESAELDAAEESDSDAEETEEASQSDEDQGDAEPEDFEFEYQGEKFKLPSKLRDAVMLRQDYTRKTQEAAEARRTAEERESTLSERQKVVEQVEELARNHTKEFARVVTLEQLVDGLKNTDLSRLDEDGRAEVLNRRYTLEQQLEQARSTLGKVAQERSLAAQEQFRRSGEQAWRECEKRIPKWSAEKRDRILEHAVSLGYSKDIASKLQDPVAFEVLENDRKWRELQAKQKQAARRDTVQEQKPVQRARSNGRSPSSQPKDTDDIKTWMDKERKRVAARA